MFFTFRTTKHGSSFRHKSLAGTLFSLFISLIKCSGKSRWSDSPPLYKAYSKPQFHRRGQELSYLNYSLPPFAFSLISIARIAFLRRALPQLIVFWNLFRQSLTIPCQICSSVIFGRDVSISPIFIPPLLSRQVMLLTFPIFLV